MTLRPIMQASRRLYPPELINAIASGEVVSATDLSTIERHIRSDLFGDARLQSSGQSGNCSGMARAAAYGALDATPMTEELPAPGAPSLAALLG
jgi:hypothetical protein